MSKKFLHIISLNVPYPPDYGGMIDIFYTIKNLSESDINIHLHCFQYDRPRSEELEKLCNRIYYYPRKTGWTGISLKTPYIVYSRRNRKLLENLLKDDYPILFEGIHGCYYLDHFSLKNRFKIVRAHNVEHDYYNELSKASRSIFKKIYCKLESKLLLHYERIITKANLILAISEKDKNHFESIVSNNDKAKVRLLAAFHPFNQINIQQGIGNYTLYHGNLSVPENEYAAAYLISEIFSKSNIPFFIAGLNPTQYLKKIIRDKNNIQLIANPTQDELQQLISEAQINIIPSFQPTGFKLKLLNALFNGRHCLVNEKMVAGTSLAPACHIANTTEDYVKKIDELFGREVSLQEIMIRKNLLDRYYNNEQNARKLTQNLS